MNENPKEGLIMEENPIHNNNREDNILMNKHTKNCAKPMRRSFRKLLEDLEIYLTRWKYSLCSWIEDSAS